jgi:hypothetical protein
MSKSYAIKGNKPVTFADLLGIADKIRTDLSPKAYAKLLKQPVTISSDEEGNGFGKLWQVDVDEKGGQILFWPADAQF